MVLLFGGWFQAVGADSRSDLHVHDPDEIGMDFDESDDCIVHDFTPVGQVLHASGSIGGLHQYRGSSVTDATGAHIPIVLPGPQSGSNPDAIVLRGLDPDPLSDHVAIIVLDDFENDVSPLDHGALTTTDSEEDFVRSGVSHGSMVMAHINALIRDTGAYTPQVGPQDATEWTGTSNGQTLEVVGVQLAGNRIGHYIEFDPELIRDQIRNQADEVRPDASIVVNMSWVILPCSAVNDLAELAARDPDARRTYENYLEELRRLGWDQEALMHRYSPTDMANTNWTTRSDGGQITLVAASGNQGQEFEFFPAAFPDVISVGAREADSSSAQRADYSNAARVLATGGWFPLAYLCCDGGTTAVTTVPADGLAYAGTSFAAPSMSVLAAILADRCAYPQSHHLRERTNVATGVILATDICN